MSLWTQPRRRTEPRRAPIVQKRLQPSHIGSRAGRTYKVAADGRPACLRRHYRQALKKQVDALLWIQTAHEEQARLSVDRAPVAPAVDRGEPQAVGNHLNHFGIEAGLDVAVSQGPADGDHRGQAQVAAGVQPNEEPLDPGQAQAGELAASAEKRRQPVFVQVGHYRAGVLPERPQDGARADAADAAEIDHVGTQVRQKPPDRSLVVAGCGKHGGSLPRPARGRARPAPCQRGEGRYWRQGRT